MYTNLLNQKETVIDIKLIYRLSPVIIRTHLLCKPFKGNCGHHLSMHTDLQDTALEKN